MGARPGASGQRAGSTWEHAVRGIVRRVVVWGELVQAAGKLPL
jgi:hypothetical protein